VGIILWLLVYFMFVWFLPFWLRYLCSWFIYGFLGLMLRLLSMVLQFCQHNRIEQVTVGVTFRVRGLYFEIKSWHALFFRAESLRCRSLFG
jgi:hypothetical protein